jgi:hypothetical protein
MNNSMSLSPQPVTSLKPPPVDSDLILAAIAQVIRMAKAQGRSLEDVKTELLTDHNLLDPELRLLLSEIVTRAWEAWPTWEPQIQVAQL